MYPVSDAFLEQARSEDQVALARVDFCDPDGTVLWTSINTLSGSVVEDANRVIRRTCQVQLVDADGSLAPRDADDLLMPLGNEMRIYRGLLVPERITTFGSSYSPTYEDFYGSVLVGAVGYSTQWVPLGVFGISRPQVSSTDGASVITVDGYDRSRRIQRAALTNTWTMAAGVDLAAAIDSLLADRWPQCPPLLSLAPAQTLTHRAVFDLLADPWAELQDLVTDYGCELLFDETGRPTLRPVADPTLQPPVVSYERGLSNVITRIDRALDDERSYSGVIVIGESTSGFPVRVTQWDDDPASPTWYLGNFGKVVYARTSSHITATYRAEAVAAALLAKKSGVLEDVAHEQIPNPALQAGDIVANSDPVLGVSGQFSLERIETPLGAALPQRLTAKARRIRWS